MTYNVLAPIFRREYMNISLMFEESVGYVVVPLYHMS